MISKTIRLMFYVPRVLEDTQKLKKVRDSLKVDMKKIIIDEKEKKDLKFEILLGLSISKKMRIKLARKLKFLYPHLVVFNNDEPITFYPQERVGQEITIEEFLEGLLKGKLRYLHDKFEIEDVLIGKRK